MSERITIELSRDERDEFYRLRPYPDEAWNFWKRVAGKRGLDYRSIICGDDRISALPLGHSFHWCHPLPLKCKRRAVVEERP